MYKTNTKKSLLNWAVILTASLLIVGIFTGCIQKGSVKEKNEHTKTNSIGHSSTVVHTIDKPQTTIIEDKTYTVADASFVMKKIKAANEVILGDDTSNTNKRHTVSLSEYYIGETEVTQELWEKVMKENPCHFKENPEKDEEQKKRPVEYVTWFMAVAFCNELTKQIEGLGDSQCVYYLKEDYNTVYTKDHAKDKKEPIMQIEKKGFRLPTEAEWEWAANGGKDNKWAGTSNSNEFEKLAWYNKNSNNKTHEVKKKEKNGYGLYDMSGNVYEWCWDWWTETTPEGGKDPIGSAIGTHRVIRGGGWCHGPVDCACAYKHGKLPSYRTSNIGLRLVFRP